MAGTALHRCVDIALSALRTKAPAVRPSKDISRSTMVHGMTHGSADEDTLVCSAPALTPIGSFSLRVLTRFRRIQACSEEAKMLDSIKGHLPSVPHQVMLVHAPRQ